MAHRWRKIPAVRHGESADVSGVAGERGDRRLWRAGDPSSDLREIPVTRGPSGCLVGFGWAMRRLLGLVDHVVAVDLAELRRRYPQTASRDGYSCGYENVKILDGVRNGVEGRR
ncbi:Uncharacterised protein [Mycobacterium tuberculosis]|nr:Uncharacterised protein [Mycobacterium tuberculosis]